jgi:hypothetical protein
MADAGQRRRDLLGLIGAAPVVHGNAIAGGRKRARDRGTNPAGCAGHQNRPTITRSHRFDPTRTDGRLAAPDRTRHSAQVSSTVSVTGRQRSPAP